VAAALKPALAPPTGAVAVAAPLLGIYYRAPKPGDAPFVEVGDQVTPDSIVGIIEVMKLMNTVRAGVSGEVLRIDTRNGELVEFGETILFVKPR
jgi:acetyl-CoA carboxylase biotin carboxyl carrier protein